MPKIWKLPLHDAVRIATLSRDLQVPAVLAQLLLNRGMTEPAAARYFLEASLKGLHDPSLLTGASEAANRIASAIQSKRRIVIYGDYDVDGVTSLALLTRVLRAYGAEAPCFLPLRADEGYGLSPDGVARCVAEYAPRLLIAVDCGT